MALGERPVRVEAERGASVPRGPEGRRWLRIVIALLWVLSCSVLGSALLVLPWLGLWERNYFASLAPGWSAVWLSPYLRGAVTGVGVVNVGISFCELLRLWKWWFPEES